MEAGARAWCQRLEAGDILYFPQTPIRFRSEDLSFLLGQQQTGSTLHKNIAYKPNLDSVSGLDAGTTGAAELKQLQAVMRQYSQDVTRFLTGFLSPYEGRWQLDYASFRPQEEEGRDLPLRRRNDLLHTDAFPTRPTRGARILRFFNNIHPTRSRDWVVSDPFPVLAPRYAPQEIPLPAPGNSASRALRSLANTAGLGYAIPSLKRSPYDDFMMRFHNFLKENASFQADCRKEYVQFPARLQLDGLHRYGSACGSLRPVRTGANLPGRPPGHGFSGIIASFCARGHDPFRTGLESLWDPSQPVNPAVRWPMKVPGRGYP